MDFKQNALFFNHKRTRFWTNLSYTSYIFFGIAVVVLFATYGFVAAALPFASVGVVIILTSFSMITTEKQIKEQIALLQKGAKEAALEHFDYPNQEPDLFFEFEGYDLADETLPIRKRKNGRVFSSVYVITYIMMENNMLRIWEKKSSILEDKEEIITKDVPFTELSGAESHTEVSKRVCIDGVEKEIPMNLLTVKDKDGNVICTAYCKTFNYDIDRLCENLAHNIKRANMAAAK